ncbi:MAG TPA: hypothetical protein VG796_07810 [Verrucomicrobiales bacterium]|nr:hypothetical protein [Verrucomicrobiales bacterium]
MRTGKIAQLPSSLQEEINRRIEEGEPGQRLLDWLNADPRVQDVLRRLFKGRPINQPNLTHWKQGGYTEWQILRQVSDPTLTVTDAPGAPAPGFETVHRAAQLLAARHLRSLTSSLGNGEAPPSELKRLCRLTREITILRRIAREDARKNLPFSPPRRKKRHRHSRRPFKTPRSWHGGRHRNLPTHTPTPTPTPSE